MTAIPGGIIAALITPRAADGSVAHDDFERLVEFVVSRGVRGLCIGGGSSEYPALDPNERKELFHRTAAACPKGRVLLAGIGHSSFIRAALEARGLPGGEMLLPPAPARHLQLDESKQTIGDQTG
jgi:4-hydroxy-tetrahydrodipicolinate synthase